MAGLHHAGEAGALSEEASFFLVSLSFVPLAPPPQSSIPVPYSSPTSNLKTRTEAVSLPAPQRAFNKKKLALTKDSLLCSQTNGCLERRNDSITLGPGSWADGPL